MGVRIWYNHLVILDWRTKVTFRFSTASTSQQLEHTIKQYFPIILVPCVTKCTFQLLSFIHLSSVVQLTQICLFFMSLKNLMTVYIHVCLCIYVDKCMCAFNLLLTSANFPDIPRSFLGIFINDLPLPSSLPERESLGQRNQKGIRTQGFPDFSLEL